MLEKSFTNQLQCSNIHIRSSRELGMTNQQNNTIINMMLNGTLVKYFNPEDNQIMVNIFDKSFKWVYVNLDGSIVKYK